MRRFMMVSTALVICAGVASGCSSGDGTGPDEQLPNDLVFRRADGSQIQFGASTFIWCGPWDEGGVSVEALRIVVGGPQGQSYWDLRAVISDVSIGTQLAFPNEYIWDEPKDADLFTYDPPNECSTQDGRSSGHIVFQELSCGAGGTVRFSIDAVVGSEFGNGPSITVQGDFQGPVGQPPG